MYFNKQLTKSQWVFYFPSRDKTRIPPINCLTSELCILSCLIDDNAKEENKYTRHDPLRIAGEIIRNGHLMPRKQLIGKYEQMVVGIQIDGYHKNGEFANIQKKSHEWLKSTSANSLRTSITRAALDVISNKEGNTYE